MRLSGLDGLRALAVLAVLVFHADSSLLPGGFLGVDLFFVISGYLITRILLRELAETGGLNLVRFYLRRAIRLLPALLVLLVAITVVGTCIWSDEAVTLRPSVLATLGYVGNWWLIGAHQSYFVASGRPPMLQHLWSLAIEEQFYLMWPLVLVLAATGGRGWWRRIGLSGGSRLRLSGGSRLRLSGGSGSYPGRTQQPRRFGRVAVISMLLAGVSTAAMAILAIRSGVPFATDSSRVYFGSDTHSVGLLMGAAFGALAERLDLQPARGWRVRRWFTDLIGCAALAGMVVLVCRVDEFSTALYRGGFLVVSAVAVVLVSTVARTGSRLGWLLDRQPLRWLGDRSYAVYLWHWPVIVVTRPGIDLPDNRWLVLSIRLLVPLGLAVASQLLVERPARLLADRFVAGRTRRQASPRSQLTRGQLIPRGQLLPRVIGATGFAMLLVILISIAQGRQSGVGVRTAAVENRSDAQPTSTALGLAEAKSTGPLTDIHPKAAIVTQPKAATVTQPKAATDSQPKTAIVTQPKTATQPAPVHAVAVVPKPQSKLALTAFGDSVMLGAKSSLLNIFPHCDVRAVEGRQPYLTLREVRDDHAAGRLAPVVVIHTGNNGIIRAADLTDTLQLLRDRQRVVLLTDRVAMDWQAPNNATIKRVTRGFSNVVVLDWYARSNGNQSWFYSDGLHLRPAGAVQYAELIAAATTS